MKIKYTHIKEKFERFKKLLHKIQFPKWNFKCKMSTKLKKVFKKIQKYLHFINQRKFMVFDA